MRKGLVLGLLALAVIGFAAQRVVVFEEFTRIQG